MTGVRHPLDAIFRPRGIAVIGVSNAMHKFGARRFRSIIEGGYSGPLYPIHPTTPEILGHKTYPSLRALPGPVDLVVLTHPGDAFNELANYIEPYRIKTVGEFYGTPIQGALFAATGF